MAALNGGMLTMLSVNSVIAAQGRILMTHPTKAITHTLLRDFVKVIKSFPSMIILYNDHTHAVSRMPTAAGLCQGVADWALVLHGSGIQEWSIWDAIVIHCLVKVSRGSADEGLYTEKDLVDTLERTEVMDFYQTVDIDGIRVCFLQRNALEQCHILSTRLKQGK